MKGIGTVVFVVFVLCLAAPSFGQPPPVIQQDTYRDVRQLRDDIDAAAEREKQLEKSENVRETMQRPPLPEPQPVSEGLRERLVLVQDQLLKLQGDKDLAVQQGKPAEEIAALDAKIKKLQQQVAALQMELGMVPQ